VREDGRIVGGEEWHDKVYNRKEWKKNLKIKEINDSYVSKRTPRQNGP
jgi:hypothetical protein